MAIKYISNHWAKGGVRRLDTKTGRSHRTLKYSWEDAPDLGWAIKLGFKWYFHYQHNNQWFFQHQNTVIPNDDDHSFSVEQVSKRRRQLTITQDGNTVFRVTYKFKGYWVSRFDPTYDFMDASSDDPLLDLIDWGDE